MRQFLSALTLCGLLTPFSANATTPPPWMVEWSQCVGTKFDSRIGKIGPSISMVEAETLAIIIQHDCERLMPAQMSELDKLRYYELNRRDLVKRIRYHVKARTYAPNN